MPQNQSTADLKHLKEQTSTARNILNELMQLPAFDMIFSTGEQQSVQHLRDATHEKALFLSRVVFKEKN